MIPCRIGHARPAEVSATVLSAGRKPAKAALASWSTWLVSEDSRMSTPICRGKWWPGKNRGGVNQGLGPLFANSRHESFPDFLGHRKSWNNYKLCIVRAANRYWISVFCEGNEALSKEIFLNFGSKYWNFRSFFHNYRLKILKFWEMLLKILKL